jgi:sugar-specific transcriptional regulator TrmB
VAIKVDFKVLQEVGLTYSEVQVYLVLLELGPATAGPLLNKTGFQNSVLHRALNSLVQKGLVGFVFSGKNKVYQSEPPQRLLGLLDQTKKGLEEILPVLEKKTSVFNQKYSSEMFLGLRGVFSAILSLIENGSHGDELLSFSVIEPHEVQEIYDFYRKYYLVRKEKGIITKIMGNNRARITWEKQYTVEQLKFLHARYTDIEFPQGVIIFQDKLLLIQYGKAPSAVKIINKEMTENFRKFFYSVYNKEKDFY